jgi:hypothetical protein
MFSVFFVFFVFLAKTDHMAGSNTMGRARINNPLGIQRVRKRDPGINGCPDCLLN